VFRERLAFQRILAHAVFSSQRFQRHDVRLWHHFLGQCLGSGSRQFLFVPPECVAHVLQSDLPRVGDCAVVAGLDFLAHVTGLRPVCSRALLGEPEALVDCDENLNVVDVREAAEFLRNVLGCPEAHDFEVDPEVAVAVVEREVRHHDVLAGFDCIRFAHEVPVQVQRFEPRSELFLDAAVEGHLRHRLDARHRNVAVGENQLTLGSAVVDSRFQPPGCRAGDCPQQACKSGPVPPRALEERVRPRHDDFPVRLGNGAALIFREFPHLVQQAEALDCGDNTPGVRTPDANLGGVEQRGLGQREIVLLDEVGGVEATTEVLEHLTAFEVGVQRLLDGFRSRTEALCCNFERLGSLVLGHDPHGFTCLEGGLSRLPWLDGSLDGPGGLAVE